MKTGASLTWTRERPTEPGWKWRFIRTSIGKIGPEPVKLIELNGRLGYFNQEGEWGLLSDDVCDWMWMDLPEPQEPER